MQQTVSPDELVRSALAALEGQSSPLFVALEALPAPIYVTDADGLIIYFNEAAVNFAGRRPVIGQDRWCVTWKLYSDNGEFLPHDQCPMAEAILKQRPIRGATAVAERPDGTRVNFMPFPTPFFGKDGVFAGAVNILIDVTEQRQADSLRAQAARCRRLAGTVGDTHTSEILKRMADDYESKIGEIAHLH
jgi:PAS domain S-box-containing protein